MGAMVIGSAVIDAVVIMVKVPTVQIVNIAISIIINSIHGVIRIQPGVRSQIWMRDIKALVNDADKHRTGAGEALVPGRFRIGAIGIGGTSRAHGHRRVAAIHPPKGPVDVTGVIAHRLRL